MIGRSLEGVDRELALSSRSRRACGTRTAEPGAASASVYQNLSYEEIKPLLPAIHRAIVEPAPSGIMFADEIRLEGLTAPGQASGGGRDRRVRGVHTNAEPLGQREANTRTDEDPARLRCPREVDDSGT